MFTSTIRPLAENSEFRVSNLEPFHLAGFYPLCYFNKGVVYEWTDYEPEPGSLPIFAYGLKIYVPKRVQFVAKATELVAFMEFSDFMAELHFPSVRGNIEKNSKNALVDNIKSILKKDVKIFVTPDAKKHPELSIELSLDYMTKLLIEFWMSPWP